MLLQEVVDAKELGYDDLIGMRGVVMGSMYLEAEKRDAASCP